MKNSVRLAVASLSLNASLSWGSLPSNIPTGNALLNVIVTNTCSVTMTLQNTNATGGLNTCGMYTNGISFQSYSDFQSWITVNGSRLAGFLSGQGVSDTFLAVNVAYGAGAPCSGLSICSDMGNATNISPNQLYITSTVSSIAMSVGGVTSATIQFGSNPAYALQVVGNGIVLGNSFLTNGNNRMRLSIAASDGSTNTYTQYGNLITQPLMSMTWIPAAPDYSNDGTAWYQWFERYSYYWWYGYGYPICNSYDLFVSGTYGADTVVEFSTDNLSWSPMTNAPSIPWDTPQWMTQMAIPVNTTAYPQAFFRVKSF